MGKYSWKTRVIDTKTLYPKAPRGYRNNNPLNIRFNERNAWQGILGRDKEHGGMCVFESPRWGIRAAFKLFESYQKRSNKRTVRDMITRWAPPQDNNHTENYIRRVCEYMKCEPEFIPHFGTAEEMHDCIRMVKAMCLVENGMDYKQFITESDFVAAYKMAFTYNSRIDHAEPDLSADFNDDEIDTVTTYGFYYDEQCKERYLNGTL